jgi:hypothetical protein
MRGENLFALGVVAAFLLVTIPVMLHHEMWRDELQSWLLARDTVSLRDLFYQLRYEGHPALWYLVLRPITALSRDPRWMQWLSVAFGASSVYVFARFAPFSRVIRVLFAFGYFVVYGYTIVARSYGLQMLLLLLLCAVIAARRSRVMVGLLLILIANTTVYGGIMVLALVGAFVAEALWEGHRLHCVRQRLRGVSVVVLSGIVGVGLLVVQVRRPADAPFNGNAVGVTTIMGRGGARVRDRPFIERLTPVWRGYVPIAPGDDLSGLWQGDILLIRSPRAAPVAVALSVVMVAVAVAMLRRSVLALVFFLLSTAGVLLFSVLIYAGSLYHHGHFFLALVMALWLAASQRSWVPARPIRDGIGRRALALLDEHSQLLIGVLLILQVVGAVSRLVADWLSPFSNGKAVAAYIRAHGMQDSTIAMYPGFEAAVSGYLDRPVYEIDRLSLATYVPHSLGASRQDDAAILATLRSCCLVDGRGAILVMNRALKASDPALETSELVRFPKAIVGTERFYLYHVRSLR